MVKRIEREQDLQLNISIKERGGDYITNAYLEYVNLYTDKASEGYKIEIGEVLEEGQISIYVNYDDGLETLNKGQLKVQLKFYVDDESYSDEEANYFKEYNTNYYLNYN